MSSSSQTPTLPGSSTKARKQRIAQLFERVITLGELGRTDEIFHEEFYWPQFDLRGPDGVRTWVNAFRTAFPDIDDRVQEQVAEGDVIVTRVLCEGTQLGPFRGLPPSGRRATFTAVGIDRFLGDKVIERSAHFDIVDLMRQLGHTTLTVPAVARP
jgi:predicted ester cyclase